MANRDRNELLLRRALLLISLFPSAFAATGANWYVLPNGGDGSGSSWTAAWNEMSGINWSMVQCGDTVWIAGGIYTTSLNPTITGCPVGSQLNIRRARSDAAECTSAAGWSASYDSAIHQSGSAGMRLQANMSYVTFSGRSAASGGTNGWIITDTNPGHRVIEVDTGTFSYITWEYISINGGQGNSVSGGNDSRAFNFASSANHSSRITLYHVDISGFCSGVYLNGVDYFTFDHSSVYNENPSDEGASTCHTDEIFPIVGDHGVVRWSKFYGNTGEGIYFPSFGGGTWTDWKIYGNLFYNINAGYAKAIELEGACKPLLIANNTFYNNWADLMLDSGYDCTGVLIENNLVYSSAGLPACGTQSNNLQDSFPNPFVNLGGYDFHIISATGVNYPRNAGTNLSAYFTTDMDGNAFGADGAWDIGAYEFSVGTNPVVAVSPSSQSFGLVSGGATNYLTFKVQNLGGGTLAGTASVAPPFYIDGTAAYSLGSGQVQAVRVRYSPSGAPGDNQVVTFTGGGGASATVTGNLAPNSAGP